MTSKPMLLYVYPWMPYPRRVTIYLSEKAIPESIVKIVSCGLTPADKETMTFPSGIPKPPAGSLPILAIPPERENSTYTYIRQSSAIINYLEDICTTQPSFTPLNLRSMRPLSALNRARNQEIEGLADECLSLWNPVRMTGSKLKGRAEGKITTDNAKISKEIYQLIVKRLEYVDKFLGERTGVFGVRTDYDVGTRPSITDVVLFSFLEFVDGFYGRDVSGGFENLRKFYAEFGKGESARMVDGGYPQEMARAAKEWDEEAL